MKIFELMLGREKMSLKAPPKSKKIRFISKVCGVKKKNIFLTAEIPMITSIKFF